MKTYSSLHHFLYLFSTIHYCYLLQVTMIILSFSKVIRPYEYDSISLTNIIGRLKVLLRHSEN